MDPSSLFYFIYLSISIVIIGYTPQSMKAVTFLFLSYLIIGIFHIESLLLLLFISAVCVLYYNTYQRTVRFYKLLTILSIILVSCPLVLFKYLLQINSFQILAESIGGIIFLVGISFYTFQAIGLILDISRKEKLDGLNSLNILLYLAFFPKFIAGPIEPATKLISQFTHHIKIDYQNIRLGALLILAGLFKKYLIANPISTLTDITFLTPSDFSGLTLSISAIMARYELYCDFSGYTDIALGSALLFNIHLSQNFNHPFVAKTIGEFWQRWHMTLTGWIRHYIFYSLIIRFKTHVYLAVCLTFILIGLWHGGNYNFFIYGLLNGLLIVIYDLYSKARRKYYPIKDDTSISSAIKMMLNFFFFICLPFVLFKTTTLDQALSFYNGLFNFKRGWFNYSFFGHNYFIALAFKKAIFGIIVLEVVQYFQRRKNLSDLILGQKLLVRWSLYFILALYFVAYGDFHSFEFIYSRF